MLIGDSQISEERSSSRWNAPSRISCRNTCPQAYKTEEVGPYTCLPFVKRSDSLVESWSSWLSRALATAEENSNVPRAHEMSKKPIPIHCLSSDLYTCTRRIEARWQMVADIESPEGMTLDSGTARTHLHWQRQRWSACSLSPKYRDLLRQHAYLCRYVGPCGVLGYSYQYLIGLTLGGTRGDEQKQDQNSNRLGDTPSKSSRLKHALHLSQINCMSEWFRAWRWRWEGRENAFAHPGTLQVCLLVIYLSTSSLRRCKRAGFLNGKQMGRSVNCSWGKA